jgi:hypothetical protein
MGHLLKIKCVYSRVNMYYLASTRFPLTLKTAQVPNVAQNHTKSLKRAFYVFEYAEGSNTQKALF